MFVELTPIRLIILVLLLIILLLKFIKNNNGQNNIINIILKIYQYINFILSISLNLCVVYKYFTKKKIYIYYSECKHVVVLPMHSAVFRMYTELNNLV